ncbi:hypothetical protein pdam_00005018 [Pocillopora damicornis]|uniref:Uncharacterized protein n=1 Tax=Pocillopora damicornis TaxID=46731 RepID=A0A3M6UVK9_POCDA|nr:hypothetical protein pdam_00005018 [Pocillopora damicornis]
MECLLSRHLRLVNDAALRPSHKRPLPLVKIIVFISVKTESDTTLIFFSVFTFLISAYQRGNLFKCKEGNIFIRDTHRCNGIHECPDASDETGCDNGIEL